MKRCPECRRDYFDDSLLYCLDDGRVLLEGPFSADEPATAILPEAVSSSKTDTPSQVQVGGRTPAAPEVSPRATPTTGQTAASNVGDVKGFDKRLLLAPLALAFIVLGGFFGYRYLSTADSKQIESIAVMPFLNDSRNPEIDYLCDGMTETLINSLSQVQNLNVKARSSVFRYKGKEFDPQKIAADLNVQAILTGRIGQRGEQMILNLELIDPLTENALWGKNYDRRSSELAELQAEIIRDVSNTLQQRLSGADETKIAKQYTSDSEAYQLYLQGRFFLAKRTPADIRRASNLFTQAIEKDKSFALGHAGLADSYSLLGYYGGAPANDVFPKAKEQALAALSLDPDLAEAHRSLGFVHTVYYYDFGAGESEYRRALELNPRLAEGHGSYGTMLCRLTRFDEGLAKLRKAVELEPLSVSFARLYGDGLLMARRFDDAMRQYERAMDLDASFSPTQFSLAFLYQTTGRYPQAVEAYAKHYELIQVPTLADRARKSFARGGWNEFVREMTEASRSPGGEFAYIRATLLASVGKKDEAFDELERAYENREYLIGFLKVDPRLDPLRSDPRFATLTKKAGFGD